MTKKGKTYKIGIPPKLGAVFKPPKGAVRYRGAYGGRGSGKSFSFALMAALRGAETPLRVLCTREYQSSIKESFHAELKAAIEKYPWLKERYHVGVDYLRGQNGTEFIFKGLRRNIQAIKSMAQVDLCIVEEAEDIPETAWRDLIPTIRAPGSEIWLIWNPREEGSPVDRRFRKVARKNAVIRELNYQDNPWFPEVLEAERAHDIEALDPGTYAHIWEGAYLENSEAEILKDKIRVADFEPGESWHGPYQGLDFGFSQDPTAAIRVWIYDNRLWIEYEAGKVALELDETADFVQGKIPDFEKYVTRADSARPESISYLKRNGLPKIKGVDKWPGSVEDGIKHLRSYKEIVVHPRCRETFREGRLYRYKVDPKSGDVLPVVVDKHNHFWDSVRYALGPIIKKPKKRAGVF